MLTMARNLANASCVVLLEGSVVTSWSALPPTRWRALCAAAFKGEPTAAEDIESLAKGFALRGVVAGVLTYSNAQQAING